MQFHAGETQSPERDPTLRSSLPPTFTYLATCRRALESFLVPGDRSTIVLPSGSIGSGGTSNGILVCRRSLGSGTAVAPLRIQN
jgi:hypothetical protein